MSVSLHESRARVPLRWTCLLPVAIVLAGPAIAAHDTPEPLRDITGAQTWYSDFDFSPNFSVGYEHDDNIFATDAGEISDQVLRLNFAAQATSDWERHALRAGVGAAVTRYRDYDSEDTEDYDLSLGGRFDLSAQGNLFGSLSYARDHEARGSIESVAGDEPTQYHKRQTNLGMKQGGGRLAVTLAANIVTYDYENTPAGTGELFNDDRDRDMSSLGLRLSYARSPQWTYFAQLRSDVRNYELPLDDAGYARDSSGYRLSVGASVDLGRQLQGQLSVGLLSQDYDDRRFDTVDEFNYEGSLSWYAAEDSHLRLGLSHSLEETTLPDSPGYLYRQFSALWSQRYTDRVFGKFSASYGQADYLQSAIRDDYYEAGAGLSRVLWKGLLGTVDVRHVQRDSNQSGDDFSRNQVGIAVSGRF